MEWTVSLNEIQKTAALFWQHFPEKKIFAFHGAMGAGKTTFIHALCDVKNVTDAVGSPTFSIINEYAYPGGVIYHIDLYRLNSGEEVLRAGVEDCFYSGSICLVEWPGKAGDLLPDDTVHIYIDAIDPEHRKIRW